MCVSEQVSKEHSQRLIKAIIYALIAEKPERTGLLKPQEQQDRTTKKLIAHCKFLHVFYGIWKHNFHQVCSDLSPFL